MSIERFCLVRLKVLEGHTVSVMNRILHQECNELVTEEDLWHPIELNHNTLKTRQTSHLEKIVSFNCKDVIHTMRSTQASHGSQSVATQSRTLAKFTGQDFPPKTVYGPPGTLDNVSADAVAPVQQSLPNLVPLEPVC